MPVFMSTGVCTMIASVGGAHRDATAYWDRWWNAKIAPQLDTGVPPMRMAMVNPVATHIDQQQNSLIETRAK
jgi:hypothetical protein